MPALELNHKIPVLLGASRIHAETCPSPGTSYGKRIVRHYELDLITWGEGFIYTNGEKVSAGRGSLFIREPGMVVEGIAPYHCYYLILELLPVKSEGFAARYTPSDELLFTEKKQETLFFPTVVQLKNTGMMESLFARVYNEYILEHPAASFMIRTHLMQILLEILDEWNTSSRFDSLKHTQREHLKQILNVREVIQNHPARSYTLDDLADMSGLSRYFFCRKFKEATGETPIDYVNKCRISQAKRLLIETTKSVKEIMLECGFENESHFFRLFKRLAGTSPSLFGSLFKP